MGWSGFPRKTYVEDAGAASDILAADWAQIRAAIVERQSHIPGQVAPMAAPGVGDDITAALVNNYRSKVDVLATYYVDPVTGGAWTAASLRVAAGLSGTNWYRIPPEYSGGPTYGSLVGGTDDVYAAHANELYYTLQQLSWLPTNLTLVARKKIEGWGYSNSSWNAAFAAMKTHYAGRSWVAGTETQVRFLTQALSPWSGYTYWYSIYHYRLDDLSVTVPAWGTNIIGTKLSVQKVVDDSGASNIDVYAQANFAGVALTFACDTSEYTAWDLALVVPGNTYHYSLRANPYNVNPAAFVPNPDNYRAAGVHGALKGFRLIPQYLMCRLEMVYQ